MKKNKYLIVVFLITLFSCSSDENELITDYDDKIVDNSSQVTVSTSDFDVEIDEGLSNGSIIGTINGSTNIGDVIFSIVSQTPNNSFKVNSRTGLITVLTSNNFDYELNPQIKGVVKVSNGSVYKNSNITITLKKVEYSKVFTGDITFTSQQEIDDFGTQGYTEVDGVVQVFNNVTSLKPLETLTRVGSLLIRNANFLENLEGLENLKKIDKELKVAFCDSLTNLEEFEHINSLDGDLRIVGNDNLQSLSGIRNIKNVGGGLQIGQNDILASLEGLNLESLGGQLFLSNNPMLSDISALSKLTSIGGDLRVYGINLFTSLGEGLKNIRTIGGDIEINWTKLVNLDGLNNLNLIKGESITIYGNEFLEDLSGFGDNIQFGVPWATDHTSVYIYDNKLLKNIDALANITYYYYTLVRVIGNDSLLNIEGLNTVTSAMGVEISENPNLNSLDGLVNLKTITDNGDLEVKDNALLNDFCGINRLIQNDAIDGEYLVSGNLYNPSKDDILNGNCRE